MDFLQGAIILAVPLILAAMGELISERGGVLNIGLEGLMLCGAFTAFAVAFHTGSPGAGLAASALAGIAMAALFGVLTVVVKADQVIVGTGVNLVAMGLTGTLYRGLFGVTSSSLSVSTLPAVTWPVLESVPILGPLLFRQNLLVTFSILLAPVVWWWLFRTRTGLVLRACGEKPESADTAGYSVTRTRFMAVMAGGALAGLGGGYLSVVQGNTFVEAMTNGRGFIALALVIFGRWSPWGVVAGAFFFGLAAQAQFSLPGMGVRVAPQVIAMIPYAATLIALAVLRRGISAGPAALAQPYRR